jgi:hypothetical protein
MMGRDHTIHATAPGFVQFYRDPALHPDRKYIGVTFNRDDKLPYPKNQPRKRRLGMVALPVLERRPPPETSPSGLPYTVEQVAGLRRNPRKRRPDPHILRLRDDYSYREDNWRIGLLQHPDKDAPPPRGRGRSRGFKISRMKRVREIEASLKGRERKRARGLRKLAEKHERRARDAKPRESEPVAAA